MAMFWRALAAVLPSGDLPRLVWMRTPVALMTGWSLEAAKWVRFSVMEVSISSAVEISPARICFLYESISLRMNPMMRGLGSLANVVYLLSELASFSTDGSSRNDMVMVMIEWCVWV